MAIISISPLSKYLVTPFISSASEKVKPLKSSCFLKSLMPIFLDNEAGRPSFFSKAGIKTCAVITPPTPFLNKCLNGCNSW